MLYSVCPTCGFLLADKQLEYEKAIENICDDDNDNKNDDKMEKILDNLKIERYCCRMRMITYIDLIKYII